MGEASFGESAWRGGSDPEKERFVGRKEWLSEIVFSTGIIRLSIYQATQDPERLEWLLAEPCESLCES